MSSNDGRMFCCDCEMIWKFEFVKGKDVYMYVIVEKWYYFINLFFVY